MVSQAARNFNRRLSSIQALWSKYRQTGSVADRPRRPRRGVTTYRQDRITTLSLLHDRFLNAKMTPRRIVGIHSRTVSSQTVRNRLRIVGIKCRRPEKAPFLINKHKQACLAWSRRHLRFTREDWANILFVNETRIFLNGADGHARIYRRRGERNEECCIKLMDLVVVHVCCGRNFNAYENSYCTCSWYS